MRQTVGKFEKVSFDQFVKGAEKAGFTGDVQAAYEAIGEGGMIYSSFEDSFWIRHKGQLIRVM